MLKLYNYFRSSASFRVRIALTLKQLEYEDIPVHLVRDGGEQYASAYQEVHPQALVPALQAGNQYLTQSLAIIEYLEDCYPLPPLYPKDPYLKARIKSFALSIACEIQPLNNLRVLNYLKENLSLESSRVSQWYRHWLNQGLAALEKYVQASPLGARDFCFGDEPTMADICLVPQLYNARRFECDMTPYVWLQRIDAHCQAHPAFKQAWPKESLP